MSRADRENHKLFTIEQAAQRTPGVRKLLNIYLTKKCLHFWGSGDIMKPSKRYLYFFIFLPLFSLGTPAVVWSTAAGVFVSGYGNVGKGGRKKKNGKI